MARATRAIFVWGTLGGTPPSELGDRFVVRTDQGRRRFAEDQAVGLEFDLLSGLDKVGEIAGRGGMHAVGQEIVDLVAGVRLSAGPGAKEFLKILAGHFGL